MNQVFADAGRCRRQPWPPAQQRANAGLRRVGDLLHRSGVRQHLASLVKPRGPGICYPLALVLFAGIWLIGAALSRGVGLPVPERALPAEASPIGLLGGIVVQSSTISWSTGCRRRWGGADSRCRVCSAAQSADGEPIVWVFWSVWHAPPLRGVRPQSLENTLVEFVLILPVTILFTWSTTGRAAAFWWSPSSTRR